jgi:hypothetical protein
MADGELTLRISESLMRRLRAAAGEAGQSVADYAAALVAEALDRHDDIAEDVRIAVECERTGISYSVEEATNPFRDDGWAEARRRLDDYDRTGESMFVHEALEHFDGALRDRFATPR